ncbi:hypothetical protein K431DRAFT_280343 [Polychaeton citri CBS 116435]|uniref:Ras-GAP domain-containing protein n=1 Tax=Polychaeton citri CBS 116435 TaxID=1314669 RepID=A0A9P4QID3_9PEZI|nr:hypothetical protein K431DRAFT_280343 [Polychaeton citri CBS 116435]
MDDARSQRQRWMQDSRRRRRSPTLYDEWLNEAKQEAASHGQEQERAQHVQQQGRREQSRTPPPLPRRTSSSNTPAARHDYGPGTSKPGYSSGSTIRPVPPDDAPTESDEELAASADRALGRLDEQKTLSSTPSAAAVNTTAGDHASSSAGPSSPTSNSRTLRRNRDWGIQMSPGRGSRQEPDAAVQGMRAPSHRGGMIPRPTSRNDAQPDTSHPPQISPHYTVTDTRDVYSARRPRTRTLDERRTRDVSPGTLLSKQRHRVGSVHSPSSPEYQGREYLASVPANISPPTAPSITSLGSPVQIPADIAAGARSVSPSSSRSTQTDSLANSLPAASARRILHLMKTLQGRMSGNLFFRRGHTGTWAASYCYIQEDVGSLMYEPKGGDRSHKTLIPDLRGCLIALDMEGDVPFIEVTLPHSTLEMHLKLQNQPDFDSWYAALLCWKPLDPKGSHNNKPHLQPSAIAVAPPPHADPPPRAASAQQRERADSSRSNRRRSMISSLKEAPVIKIGKMIFWDLAPSYAAPDTGSGYLAHLGNPSAVRPVMSRLQSMSSWRWRKISGQLRENGELKLYSDADNSLVSVVQLSQLSRCAIQRLDPSVLENEFSIAVYPQYTSSPNAGSAVLRPIFLSLETRVLYEVWFVLLRAFTIPQLYGPRIPSSHGREGTAASQDLLADTISDMFRMERSLHIRIIEAKMHPPAIQSEFPHTEAVGGYKGRYNSESVPISHQGHHVEILLDDETRARTMVKYEGLNPLWGESFEFSDLPAVLSSASVVIKRRRAPERGNVKGDHDARHNQEAHGFSEDAYSGFTPQTFDTTCGKVEIYLEELEGAREVEKWWPAVNMHNQRIGEILIKARAEEGVILMSGDYRELSELLHRFGNSLTLQIAQMIPGELKRLSDYLLNIFQVSGRASEWLMSLVEEEIDGLQKETPMSRLRYSRRMGSHDNVNEVVSGSPPIHSSDRELLVRDLNKNAALEANLLFRGNTLLTKSLDSHMRRVGKVYLEDTLGSKLREINEKDPDCEVDPNRAGSAYEVERNWKRLLNLTQQVWNAISASRHKCPIELRMIFRHIKACAEDKYGDFLRTVSYSSVSGFLFLRFYCPAVLNPGIFGLVKDAIKPRARRTFTLVAKSLQTLANMASFGNKEPWMEQMNTFLVSHRDAFKHFIDDVCYVPTPVVPNATFSSSTGSSPTYPPGVHGSLPPGFISAETHHSYTTPMTIMHRLPPTSREGFPSLPYLIDQARAFADLIQLWLESTAHAPQDGSSTISLAASIKQEDGDLLIFHEICTSLHARTQEALNRAERAERPNSAYSFKWEELIDQLQDNHDESADELLRGSALANGKERVASDATLQPPIFQSNLTARIAAAHLRDSDEDAEGDDFATIQKIQESIASASAHGSFDRPVPAERRPSAFAQSLRNAKRQSMQQASRVRGDDLESPSQSGTSASASAVSSAVSSDNEATALPSYERHRQHTPTLEMNFQDTRWLHHHHHHSKATPDKDKEKHKRVNKLVPALRRKRDRERERERERAATPGGYEG